jgi:hypothetical protein
MHARLQQLADMIFEEIVPQLMAHAETLKAFTGNKRCVDDAEIIAVAQQHPRDAVMRFCCARGTGSASKTTHPPSTARPLR